MKTLRAGILGCGGFAGAHARRLKAIPGVQIVALCDKSETQIQGLVDGRLADYVPAPGRYTDPAKMFAEAKLDIVAIVTPHVLHYVHAVQALDAGCHVLLEKPMTTNAGDARLLAAKAGKSGKVLLVAYNTAYTRPFQWLRETIRSRQLGKVELVCGYLSQDWKRLTKGSWRHDAAVSGGGQVIDSGAHMIGGLCWAMESAPVEAYACMDMQDAKVDINTAAVVRFANGAVATLAVGGNCPANGSHMGLMFDAGRVEIDGWNGGWVRAWKGSEELMGLPAGEGEPNPDANLVAAVRGEAEPLCTAGHGVVAAVLTSALFESARLGKPVLIGS